MGEASLQAWGAPPPANDQRDPDSRRKAPSLSPAGPAPCLSPQPHTVPHGGVNPLITFGVCLYSSSSGFQDLLGFPRHGLTASLRNWTV